jgi:hypothetical protein
MTRALSPPSVPVGGLDQNAQAKAKAARAAKAIPAVPADARPLTEAQISLVKATAPALREHGVTITKRMYKVSVGRNL